MIIKLDDYLDASSVIKPYVFTPTSKEFKLCSGDLVCDALTVSLSTAPDLRKLYGIMDGHEVGVFLGHTICRDSCVGLIVWNSEKVSNCTIWAYDIV